MTRTSIVWSTRPAHAETLLALSDADFLHTLQQNIGDVLGELEGVGPRGAFQLRLSHTREYVRPRLALIGDAAHSIHPLAGQGVNLGVADAASLVQVITQALKEDKDIGALQVLRRYERWRKGENLSMMFAMDAFKRLFGNEHAAVRWARNTGLNLTDHLPPLKQLIIRQAMGLSGELPDLARQVHSRD